MDNISAKDSVHFWFLNISPCSQLL